MEEYFADIEGEVQRTYDIAGRCRARGFDVDDHVEIPIAKDLPDRVEQLVGPPGVAQVIRDLDTGNRERTAIDTAIHIAREAGRSPERAIDQAIRTGLAVLTEGILVAPLEGIASVYIGRNGDGTSYLGIKFSGPIRSAGGTGQALSVLIGDLVRRELGIGAYRATEAEVQRFKEEIPLYKRTVSLQYLPSDREIDLISRNCPVCIDGEPTEKVEISGQRDLPRIDTNRVRGGMCLVISEGIALKASKIQKHVSALEIEGWGFLDNLRGTGAAASAANGEARGRVDVAEDAEGEAHGDGNGAEGDGTGEGGGEDGEGGGPANGAFAPSADPSEKYMKDLIVGRPVFAHPSRPGGFRLRYGRARTTGLAAVALNPATMAVLDGFLALGTQLKTERPGKAGTVTSCTAIEGPLVLLDDGELRRVDTFEEAVDIVGRISRVIDLGEILVPFGEFMENNQRLVPGGYPVERWAARMAEAASIPFAEAIAAARAATFAEAMALSREHALPLHPDHNLFWHDVTVEDVLTLSRAVRAAPESAGPLGLADGPELRDILVEMGCPFRPGAGVLMVERHADVLRFLFGRDLPAPLDGEEPCAFLSRACGVRVPTKAPTRVGGRMGRPEKAAPRQMKPPVHGLFPLGTHGGQQRLLSKAAEEGRITVEIGARQCQRCNSVCFRSVCCGAPTSHVPPRKRDLDVAKAVAEVRHTLDLLSLPPMKGVKGLISAEKVPEPLVKGVLRAHHGVFVNKDGTVRYEYMDAPLTHFRPREVGTTVERLRELGYTTDARGDPLERDDQLLELRVQDFIPPRDGGEYMVKVAGFVDDLLERFYGEEPFYRAERPEDLVGHLIVGLAPHTSGGVLGRIIGFTPTQCGFAHPFYHAAKRRNCDGDADTFFLLLDGLLNFSRRYLPSSRGGQMDAPLVMPIRVTPDEVDKEALNVDASWHYPASFYEAADRAADPKEVAGVMALVADHVASGNLFQPVGFTHDTEDFNRGPTASSYALLGNMQSKLESQMALAERVRSVDEADVARRLIEGHLLPDIMGNMRTFCQQSFRCVKCGAKYRRVPLSGKCSKCGQESLLLTVHEGNVTKYVELARGIADKYNLSPYVKQRLDMLDMSIRSMFDGGEGANGGKGGAGAGAGAGTGGGNGRRRGRKKAPSACLEDFL
ncbi:MAG: DNA polymerase II large subunit [Thermoplasmata archaeon]|nr:DNA polymerase II large subunit [Thermoplasmata archaeon]